MSNASDQIPDLSVVESVLSDWHRELLQTRIDLIESGKAVYQNWNEAKKELRERMA